eukprot:1002829-Prorocentrum_minimum.AAC.1
MFVPPPPRQSRTSTEVVPSPHGPTSPSSVLSARRSLGMPSVVDLTATPARRQPSEGAGSAEGRRNGGGEEVDGRGGGEEEEREGRRGSEGGEEREREQTWD